MKKFYTLLTALIMCLSAQAAYYVTGNAFGGWSLPGNAMTETEPGVWVLEKQGICGPSFKITDGTWNLQIGLLTEGKIVTGQTYSVKDGGENVEWDGKIQNPVITFDSNNMQLTVNGIQSDKAVSIAGCFNSWSTDANVALAGADGIAEIVVTGYQNSVSGQDIGFKVVYPSNTWLGLSHENGMGLDTWTGVGGDKNITLPEEAVGRTVTFLFNTKDKTLRASASGQVVETWYLVGAWINGESAWSVNPSRKFTETSTGIFTLENINLGGAFKVMNGSWAGDGGIEYGSSDLLANGVALPLVQNGADINFANDITDINNATVVFDSNALTLTVTGTGVSGIDSIDADNDSAPAVYYNLQGQRLTNPKGLVFKKQDNNVYKELVR